jgi:hypothetical protein
MECKEACDRSSFLFSVVQLRQQARDRRIETA